MKTHVYACYLPGSELPDYIGSHNAEPPERSLALRWRYACCKYLGAGAWLMHDKKPFIPRICVKHSRWAAKLLTMTADELAAIRVETLETVDVRERWTSEARQLRRWRPPYNELIPQTADAKREKHNAYHKAYRKGYYARNPEKAAAKRAKDRERVRAKRAAKAACSIT